MSTFMTFKTYTHIKYLVDKYLLDTFQKKIILKSSFFHEILIFNIRERNNSILYQIYLFNTNQVN